MATEGGAAPMEEEQVPVDSPSAGSASMDWVKVDDKTEDGVESHSRGGHGVDNAPTKNFDEYSFGSSDNDEDEEEDGENGLEDMANVSLDTSFDMEILRSSIEKSKEALDLVVGKDVVMVVGKTGVGKSTLIQGIAGKRIHTSFHKASFSGQTATKTVFDAHDALPNFEIGHAKVSKTRSLNAFLRKDNDSEVVYLDSPGLEDTRGVEMDIATSALLSQVAKRCKCLRFVILIHCASLLEDRGNAFRSILQFAHKFVDDFSKSKMSFMFLFTHSNEIASMSNDDGKKWLQEEVIQIAGATEDEDVRAALEFVRKSLKKGYPFADILLPTGTNYQDLVAQIEKLKPVSDLASAGRCNLTLSSKMKLEVAVLTLLERLQAEILSSSPNNTAHVKDILQTFHYLREYVVVDSVLKAAMQSEEIMDGHKKELMRTIELEFTRWLSPTSGFDQANAKSLQDALLLLQDFDSTFSSKHWIQSKKEDALKLQNVILTNASRCKKFYRELKKMKAWDCGDFYLDTCSKLTAIFKEAADVISNTDVSALHKCSDDEVSRLVEKVLIVQSMCGITKTEIPEINMGNEMCQRDILEDLKRVFESWTAADAAKLTAKDVNFNCDFQDTASHVRVLECMEAVLRDQDIGIDALDKSIKFALSSLESCVISLFTECCDELRSSPFDPSWEEKLHWMCDTCGRFSKMRSVRWKEMQPLFAAVIDKIKSKLYSVSGELDIMSSITRDHGMRSGERLAKDFKQFQRCIWFDSYLSQGEAFVENCCIAIELSFQERIDEKTSELVQVGSSLLEDQSVESIKALELLLPELEEIDKYLAIVGGSTIDGKSLSLPQDASMLTHNCADYLEQHTDRLINQSKKHIDKWIGCVTSAQSSQWGQKLQYGPQQ